MAEKKINGRIILKHDVESNWNKATNFVPKAGELIIYDTDATHTYVRIKVGDGSTVVTSLPFIDDTKVDKVDGKQLSTNDYTTTEKNKLAGVEKGANKTVIDDALSSTSINPVQNKVVNTALTNLNTLVGDTAVSTQITNAVSSKADITAGVYTVTASSSDGVSYTATVPGITELKNGISFIMIPGIASTNTTPTINVNGLGAKLIKRRLSNISTSLQSGYSAGWLAANLPFRLIYDATTKGSASDTGVWVVEGLNKPSGADVSGAVPQAKADASGNIITDTYATIAMLQSMLPKVTTITLTGVWNGSASPYYKDVDLSCVTETSLVTLQPTPTQLADWQDNGLAFTTLSGNGTVRIYCAGGLPTGDITIQVTVQEVVEV